MGALISVSQLRMRSSHLHPMRMCMCMCLTCAMWVHKAHQRCAYGPVSFIWRSMLPISGQVSTQHVHTHAHEREFAAVLKSTARAFDLAEILFPANRTAAMSDRWHPARSVMAARRRSSDAYGSQHEQHLTWACHGCRERSAVARRSARRATTVSVFKKLRAGRGEATGLKLVKKILPPGVVRSSPAVGRAAAWPALRHGRRQCLARARHPGAALIRTSRM